MSQIELNVVTNFYEDRTGLSTTKESIDNDDDDVQIIENVKQVIVIDDEDTKYKRKESVLGLEKPGMETIKNELPTILIGCRYDNTQCKKVKKGHMSQVLIGLKKFGDKQEICLKLWERLNNINFAALQSLPLEPLTVNDDESSCKILKLAIPQSWGIGHVRSLIAMKTTFDPTRQYLVIKPLHHDKQATKECLLRFASHAEAQGVYDQIKPIRSVHWDVGYKTAQRLGLIFPAPPKFYSNNQTPGQAIKTKAVARTKASKESGKTTTKEKDTNNYTSAGTPSNTNSSDTRLDYFSPNEKWDQDHCRVVVVKNLEGNPAPALKKLLNNAGYDSKNFTINRNVNGNSEEQCLLLCKDNRTAKAVVNIFNGRSHYNRRLELYLDIGGKQSRCFKIRQPGTEYLASMKNMENMPDEEVTARYEDPNINIFSMKPNWKSNRQYSRPSWFGLKEKFLNDLGIRPPLTTNVLVENLHDEVNTAMIYEIFSMAGNIKNIVFYNQNSGSAKITYEHPVEAVQAISLFDGQVILNMQVSVKMQKSQSRSLPFGLQTIGKGLGPEGSILPAVSSQVAVKHIQEMLGDLGFMRPVPTSVTSTAPFHVDSYVWEPTNTTTANVRATKSGPRKTDSPESTHTNKNALKALQNTISNMTLNTEQRTALIESLLHLLNQSNPQGTPDLSLQQNTWSGAARTGQSVPNFVPNPPLPSASQRSTFSGAASVPRPVQTVPNFAPNQPPPVPPVVPAVSVPNGSQNVNKSWSKYRWNKPPLVAVPPQVQVINPMKRTIADVSNNSARQSDSQSRPELIEYRNFGQVMAPNITSPNEQGNKDRNQERCDKDNYHPKRSKTDTSEEYEDKSDLVLFSNLPSCVTAEALTSKMEEVGEVIFAHMTGNGRALIRYRHHRDVERCIKLFHHSKVNGQVINATTDATLL